MAEAEEFKRKFFSHIEQDRAHVINLLNVQVRSIVFFQRVAKPIILSDGWFQMYLFGACDALSTRFPLELRERLAPEIINICYRGYLVREFIVSPDEAERLLEKSFLLNRDGSLRDAVVAGGVDGVAAMLNRPGETQLLTHFGFDHEGALSAGEEAAFRRFCTRQDETPTL